MDSLDFEASEFFGKIILPGGRSSSKKEKKIYVKWVNTVLQVRKCLKLEEFRIHFDLTNSSTKHIDEWIEYPFECRVQRLELDFVRDSFSKCYSFEKILKGSGFMFLRELSFKFVNVSGDVLQFFIYNCPFLENVVVHGSWSLIDLEVFGSSLPLRCLDISYCVNVESIILCDIPLVGLGITGVKDPYERVLIKNITTLVDVKVSHMSSTYNLGDAIRWLSCCRTQLEVLTLFLSKVKGNVERVRFPQLTGLRLLILEVGASKDRSLMGITSLIRASPNLEVFVLKLNWWGNPTRRERKVKKAEGFPLKSIKMIEFLGYYGRTSDLELINYFLENATSLEKILIDPYSALYIHFPPHSNIMEERRIARSYAQKQLEGIVPSHIELVIL